MKAFHLLLCLALARYGAGHIFKQHHINPERETIIVKHQEYFHPQQKSRSNNNQAMYERYYDNSGSSEERYRPIQHQQNQKVPRRQELTGRDNQESMQLQLQQTQFYPQSQRLYSKQQNQHYQEGAENMHTYQRVHDSSSIESNSAESQVTEDKYAMPVYADIPKDNTRLTSMRSQNRMPLSGDSIAWRGIQIAVGPKFSINKEDIEKIFEGAYNTMNDLSEENKKNFHQALVEATTLGDEDVHLNATELLNKYQYRVETHTIKTDDGYYLTLFRIPPKQEMPQRPVVFLMHGLLGSADDWLLMGPGKSLAYLLADAGFDVWLGNARGSKYARRHVTKHPAQADYWLYSNDDIALQDLPKMIDYVLKTSNQEKMYYVGHSQGTTAFFALASSRPEYNNKITMMYALSPMVYMTNVRSPLVRMLAPTSPFQQQLNKQLSYGEFNPSSELIHTVGGAMCENKIGCNKVCANVNFVTSGVNVDNLDVKLIPVIMGHVPAGASTRQIKQYAQAVASHQFAKYDYGSETNQKMYGTRQPPQYQMQKVQVPVALYYSEDDWLAHPQDVARLERELPNVKDSYKIPEQHFNHLDFQFSNKAPEVVYKRLMDSIQQQTQQNYVY